jgi:hypothetical protein
VITVNINNQNFKLTFNHNFFKGHTHMGEPFSYYTGTTARLFPENEPEMAIEGHATLHPDDNPNYAVGRKIALTRLTRRLTKELSAEVWKAVRESGTKINVTIPRGAVQERNL